MQVRALLPVLHGVRDTGPGTPRKADTRTRRTGEPSGTSKAATKPMNRHEEREIAAGYAKWYLDQPIPLPRKVIAAKVGLSLDVLANIVQGRSYADIPPMRPPKP